MHCFETIIQLFPEKIASQIKVLTAEYNILPEEIRVRRGQPLCIRSQNKEFTLNEIVSANDIAYIMMSATNGSFHSSQDTLKKGYLPLKHGARLGFCGEAATSQGEIRNIRNITSICIRVAHQIPGCADEIYPQITTPYYKNTIIIAPPGMGKTTLLRELIRLLSNNGYYVCVADERGEIAGMYRGMPEFDLGSRSDVSVGISKQQSSMMMLKTMAPDILAMDEITALQDTPAIIEAIGCGVGLLTTMHGRTVSDIKKPSFMEIYETHAFEYAILIRNSNGERIYTLEKLE